MSTHPMLREASSHRVSEGESPHPGSQNDTTEHLPRSIMVLVILTGLSSESNESNAIKTMGCLHRRAICSDSLFSDARMHQSQRRKYINNNPPHPHSLSGLIFL